MDEMIRKIPRKGRKTEKEDNPSRVILWLLAGSNPQRRVIWFNGHSTGG
jgi:hypothetical protein